MERQKWVRLALVLYNATVVLGSRTTTLTEWMLVMR